MGYFSVRPPVATYERMKLHTEDAATLTHWPFQGSIADNVGSNDVQQAESFFRYQRVSGLDTDSDLLALSTRTWASAVPTATVATPDIKTIPGITVACWMNVNANPASNQAVVGIRAPGGGSTYNFPWELGILTTGNIRFFWQSGSKTYEGTDTNGVPLTNGLGRWHHLIGTRNATSDTARLYMNGQLVDEATGLTAWSGGSNQNLVRFFSNGLGVNACGQFISAIIKNTYADTATAAALYDDAREIVE